MWSYLFVGLVLGILMSVPVAAVWGRRTERRVRQLEQRTRAAERLAELGTLTGGLAHEIKNPLSTVGLNIQLVQEDLAEVVQHTPPAGLINDKLGRIQRRFDALARETQRLRDILEDFLRFAGRMELDRSPTDINSLVGELVDFFHPQADQASVNVRAQLAASPAVAVVDASLLKQALLNLLINAIQAMTEAREQDESHGGADELIIWTERKRALGEDVILVHVIDTGPGMPPELAAKVFQPYFSTKRGGSGLGLPTARRIIEEHDGQLNVHAAPGRGTDFTITLPTASATATSPAT